jgi:pilus assembly protein CpaF
VNLEERIQAARNGATATPGLPEARQGGAVRELDPFAGLKQSVHSALLESLGPKLYDAKMQQSELEQRVRQTLQTVLDSNDSPMTATDRSRIAQEIADEILGYGPLEPLLRDSEISEVMVNGHDQIYVERSGRITATAAVFSDEAHLRRTIDKIVGRVGRRVDESSPMVDARLADGSRVNAVVAPIALDGSLLTIRKFATDPFGVEDLIGFGTMSRVTSEFLNACVRGRLNVVISGGTGSGKTTTLNVVSSFIPDDERIVTIEDAAELQLRQQHVLRLESRPAEHRGSRSDHDPRPRPQLAAHAARTASLSERSRRRRPRHAAGDEHWPRRLDHDRALERPTRFDLAAGDDGPDGRDRPADARDPRAGRECRRSHRAQQRLRDGSRRITHITEVVGMEGDVITLQDIFLYDFGMGVDQHGKYRGSLKSTGLRPRFLDKLTDSGVHLPPNTFTFDQFAR